MPARFGTGPFLLFLDLLVLGALVVVTVHLHAITLLFLGSVAVLYEAGGLYLPRLSLSALDDAPDLVGKLLVAAMLAVLVASVTSQSPQSQLISVLPLLAAAVLAQRALSYAVVRWCRTRRWVAHRTLILGAGKVAGQLAATLSTHPDYGLLPIGFLDSDPLLAVGDRPVPLLGGYDKLAEVIRTRGVGVVVVAFGSMPESEMIRMLRECDRFDCAIFFVPRLFELSHQARGVELIWGIPLVRRRQGAFRWFPRLLKRALDLAVAGTALLVLSPLLLAIAIAVRLTDGPGVLFRQERVGVDGQSFTLMKFRTLRSLDDQESATLWSVSADRRVGRVGRLLRSTSLDELPQLINVLRGEMSLVGPRPERPYFVNAFSDSYPHYMARHRLPSGLTGWAQVHGLRGDTSIDERARFDNVYIENWSLGNDLKILARTVGHLLHVSGR